MASFFEIMVPLRSTSLGLRCVGLQFFAQLDVDEHSASMSALGQVGQQADHLVNLYQSKLYPDQYFLEKK